MKKIVFSLLAVSMLFASCKKEEPMGTVTLDPTSKEVYYDEPYQIKPVFSIEGQVTSKSYTWKSDAIEIATVKAAMIGGAGDVTPKRIGEANIVYASTDGAVTATSKVTVKPRSSLLNGIYFKQGVTSSEIKNNVGGIFEFNEENSTAKYLEFDGGGKIEKLIYELNNNALEVLWVIVKDNPANKTDAEHYIKERFDETGKTQPTGITYFRNTGISSFPINTVMGLFVDKTVNENSYSFGVHIMDNSKL